MKAYKDGDITYFVTKGSPDYDFDKICKASFKRIKKGADTMMSKVIVDNKYAKENVVKHIQGILNYHWKEFHKEIKVEQQLTGE